MNLQLGGFHHLTAITANAAANHAFYTQTLGLRLVKKTVNQDDVSAYHLFYGDGAASPGSDITFFDWPAARERRGTQSIVRTGFSVSGPALEWWRKRFAELRVAHGNIVERAGRQTLDFEDGEGQRLILVADDSRASQPWANSPVPSDYQCRGLARVRLSVPDLSPTRHLLTEVMNMREAHQYEEEGRSVHVFETGPGGPAAELHVGVEPDAPPAHPGAGGVHHVAFRTPTHSEYDEWIARLRALHVPNSGPIDRYYFRSLYFREPNGILFEIATDQPGFAVDEPAAALGEHLSLPPFLESRRREIEAGLKAI